MKRLIDTEEAAKVLGITPRTIQRWFEVGKLEGEFRENNRGGKSGMKLFVWIDDDCPLASVGDPPHRPAEDGDHNKAGGEGTSIKSDGEIGPAAGGDREMGRSGDRETNRYKVHPEPSRYRVNPGEPGCHVVTELIDGLPAISQSAERTPLNTGATYVVAHNTESNTNQALPPASPALVSLGQACPPKGGSARRQGSISGGGALVNLPQPLFFKEGSMKNLPARIPASCNQIANLRFAFIQKFKKELTKEDPNLPLFKNGNGKRSKTQIVQKFLETYNAGVSYPALYNDMGRKSRATLYNWLQSYEQGGIDGLIPAYNGNAISRVTPAEKQFMRQFLLNQNQPKIADAIRKCKFILGDQSHSSPATLRRYVNNFKAEFHDVWTLDREGKKAWNDKCAPYVDRAWWTLEVGEILVADGHKLNFQVIHPHTGKPARAVLVMFWDWYSSYPVGWEVMLTENAQSIATALRNAIIMLGKTPKCVYLDNGKAFKARCFTKKIVLQETEIPGMFARLGIDVIWAMKYNAQAKPIERIFGVLEWLEREVPSFVGASINDKPANLRPNEDRAKRLRGNWTPKLDQVNDLLRQWRDFYVVQPLRGRKNQTAQELFDPGRGPGVDPKALCFLMMKAEVKGVRRERLTFYGFDWTGDCLYGIKSRVLVRYSLADQGQIYVFDLQERFLGIVTPVDASAPRDHEAGRRIISERRRLFRQTKALSGLAKAASPETIHLLTRKNPELIEYIQREEAQKEPPKLSPFIRDDNAPQDAEEPMPEAVPGETPFFDTDTDKFLWLMKQTFINPRDQAWLDDLMERTPIFKEAIKDYREDL